MNNDSTQSELEQVIAQYLEALDSNTPMNRKSLMAAHPDVAPELQSFFINHDMFCAINSSRSDIVPHADTAQAHATTTGFDGDSRIQMPSFDDYEIITEIARGGMGVVFKARQKSLNRIVALKMIKSGEFANQEQIDRFCKEAEAAANLDHPGIVPVHEVGEVNGQHYFAMGFVDGESLAVRLRNGPLSPKEAAGYAKSIAEAVAFAHSNGVIHRDLKPANALITKDGTLRITDFGLAKRIEGDSELTATGQVLGTPSYMPPEQAEGKLSEIGPPADVYAIGATLYCMLVGRPPFQAASLAEVLRQVCDEDPIPLRKLDPSIPRDLQTITLKCLEKNPEKRYPTAAALMTDLEFWLERKPISARPIRVSGKVVRWCQRNPIVAGLCVMVAVVVTTGFATTFWQWQAARGNLSAAELANQGLTNQLRLTEQQRKRADANLESAEQAVNEFFVSVAESEELLRGTPGTQQLRLQLLTKAERYYLSFIANNKGAGFDPQLALAHIRVGTSQKENGKLSEAINSIRAAIEVYERQVSLTDVQFTEYVRAYSQLAVALNVAGDAPGSVDSSKTALRMIDQRKPDGVEKNEIALLTNLGNAYGATGNYTAAIAPRQECLQRSEELCQRFPQSEEFAILLLKSYHNLSLTLQHTGKPVEAREMLERVTLKVIDWIPRAKDRHRFLYAKATALRQIAAFCLQLGDLDEGLKNMSTMEGDFKEIVYSNPGNLEYRESWANAMLTMSQSLQMQVTSSGAGLSTLTKEQIAEALKQSLAAADSALDICRYLDTPVAQDIVASAYIVQATTAASRGDLIQAEKHFKESISVYQKLVSQAPNVIEYQLDLAITTYMSGIFMAGYDTEKSKERFESALIVFQRLDEQAALPERSYPPYLTLCCSLAELLVGSADNRARVQELLATAKKHLPKVHNPQMRSLFGVQVKNVESKLSAQPRN